MNNYTLAKEAIKEQVSMRDAIALYAPNPAPRRNRIPCPIHSGQNYNLSFSDNLYHCFVCGSGGDVISFTQHIFGLPFMGALDKLNTDFSCGAILDRRPTLREQQVAQKRHSAIMAERERQAAEKQAYEDLYNYLLDEWYRLDYNRWAYAPQNMDEEFHPLFVEALHKINKQEHLINTLF